MKRFVCDISKSRLTMADFLQCVVSLVSARYLARELTRERGSDQFLSFEVPYVRMKALFDSGYGHDRLFDRADLSQLEKHISYQNNSRRLKKGRVITFKLRLIDLGFSVFFHSNTKVEMCFHKLVKDHPDLSDLVDIDKHLYSDSLERIVSDLIKIKS